MYMYEDSVRTFPPRIKAPDRSPPVDCGQYPAGQSPLTERAQVTQLSSRRFRKHRKANIEFKFLTTTSPYRID